MSPLPRTSGSSLSPRSSFALNGRNFFLAFWLAGTVLLVTLKYFSPTPVLPAVVGAVLVGLYGVLAVKWQALEISQERAGDGAYYLGFLYTLASLVVALYQFSARSEDSAFIVSSFGIALTSSITGVAVRVIIAQGRDIVGVTRDRVESELLEATERFGFTLKESIDALNAAQAGIIASLNENAARIQQATEERLSSTGEGFAGQVARALEQIEQAAQGFAANAERLNGSATSVVASSTQLCQRLEAIRPPEDVLEKKLENVFGRIERCALTLEQGARHQTQVVDKVDTLLAGVDKSAAHLHEIGAQAAEQAQTQRDLLVTLAQVRARFEDLEGYLKRVEDSGGTFLQQRQTQLDNLRDMLEEERQLFARQHDTVRQAHEGMSTLVDTLKDTLKAVSERVNFLRNITNRLPNTVEKFEVNLQHLEKITADSHLDENLAGIGEQARLACSALQAVGEAVPGLARIAQVFDSHLARQEEISQALDHLHTTLNQGIDTHLERTRTLGSTYEHELAAIRTVRAGLEEEARRTAEAVERNQNTLRTLVEGLETVATALPQLGRVGEVTETHLMRQEQVNEALVKLGERLDAAANDHLNRARSLSHVYESEQGRLRQVRETLEGEAQLSLEAIRATQTTLRGLAMGLKEEFGANA